MIEAVFFDAGETLLSPKPSFPGLAASVIRSRGHRVGDDRLLEAFRAAAPRFRLMADRGRTFSTSFDESRAFWTALYTDVLQRVGIADEGAPDELYRVFSNPENYTLFDDALPVLDELREQGLKLGVISNFETWLEGLLERLGVLDRFEVVAVSGRLGWEKPDPRIFRWAVDRMGVPAAACAHVGDQPYFDAEAALACGLHGILLDRHGRFAALEAAYPRIASLAELPDVLEHRDPRAGRASEAGE